MAARRAVVCFFWDSEIRSLRAAQAKPADCNIAHFRELVRQQLAPKLERLSVSGR